MIEKEGGRARSVRTVEEELDIIRSAWQSLSYEQQRLIKEVMAGKQESVDVYRAMASAHYIREPVDLDTFLDDPYYSGTGGRSVFPEIRKCLKEINAGRYSSVIMAGSIGWGKSYAATYGLMYSIYRLTCLRNPHESLGVAPNSMIIFGLLSMSREHCRDTLYQDFKEKLEGSAYFQELGSQCLTYYAKIMPGVRVVTDSTAGKNVIGKNLIGGIIDEVNFGASIKLVSTKRTATSQGAPLTQVEVTYDQLNRRIKSRFMRRGTVPGCLYVISSSNNEMDFTEKLINAAAHDPQVCVLNYAEWETKPPERYSGEKFRVFFGGRALVSRILEPDEPDPVTDDEFAKVIEVPIEFRQDFERDIENSIRDIAGVSVPRIMPFMSRWDKIQAIYKEREDQPVPTKEVIWYSGDPSPFRWNNLSKKRQITEYGVTKVKWLPLVNPDARRHIHLDPSLTKDKMGFVVGHIDRWVEVPLYDAESNTYYSELKPLIWIDVALAISAPPGGEITYSHVRRLIYELQEHGYKFNFVSADTYQSADMLQELNAKGIRSEIRSLDTRITGYQYCKDAIYDGRVLMYPCDYLIDELKYLQVDNIRGKIDHLPGRTKDVSDALAGVVWSLSTEVEKPMDLTLGLNAFEKTAQSEDEYFGLTGPDSLGNDPNRVFMQGRDFPSWLK